MSEYVAHVETDKETGVTLKIINDEGRSDLDPSDSDEAIIFAVLHRNYQNPAAGAASRSNVPGVKDDEGYESSPDFESSEGLRAFAEQACGEGKDWEAFPLFMYDHSGTSYRCSRGGNPFSCPWDSGQVGFIFVHKPDIGAAKGEAPDYYKAAEQFCETYTAWANGDVWGYVVEDAEGDGDSCWGFIGDSDDEYMMSDARAAFQHAIGNAKAKLDAKARAADRAAADVVAVRTYLDGIGSGNALEVLDAFNRLHPVEVTGYLDVMGVVDGDSDEADSDED